ncbi:MAG TPA: cupredoxin domain-containing protein [Candidatus Saccharimonadales bacterium]|nr:cupredoxin domain-containing protein [Candidatus Saccharimonadales bacterium]
MEANTSQIPEQDKPIDASDVTPGRRRQGKWFIKGLTVAAVLVVAVAAVLVVQNKNNASATPIASVQITDSSFSPSTIRIKKNQSVTWTNNDTAAHQIASDPYPSHSILPSLNSVSLNQNDSYTYTFENTGTFTYHDPQNPSELRGTVIVE